MIQFLIATPAVLSITVISMPLIVFFGVITAIGEAGKGPDGIWLPMARIIWLLIMAIACPIWVIRLGYSIANFSVYAKEPEFYAASFAELVLAIFILAVGILPLVYILRKKKQVRV